MALVCSGQSYRPPLSTGGDDAFGSAEYWANEAQNQTDAFFDYVNALEARLTGVQTQFPVFLPWTIGPSLTKPELPRRADMSYTEPSAIHIPDVGTIRDPNVSNVPFYVDTGLIFDDSGAPGAGPDVTLSDPAGPSDIDVEVPDYDEPISPMLNAVVIEPISDVTLPDFDVNTNILAPSYGVTSFEFTNAQYTDDQIGELKTEISRVLNGDLGIPDYIWDAIWGRAQGRVSRSALSRVRQAQRDWAKRGWDMPGLGALEQVQSARSEGFKEASNLALENSVQATMLAREDFWNAVQQGVSLQTMLIGEWNAFYERELRGAVAQQELIVAVLNANVALFNGKVVQINAEIAVKRLQLEGALATLEVDRLKIQRAIAIQEVDKTAVELYNAQWRGVQTQVSIYATTVDAAVAQVEVDRVRLETYKTKIAKMDLELRKWAQEWEGYSVKISAQNAKGAWIDSNAKVFGENVRKYGVEYDAEKVKVGADVSRETLNMDRAKIDAQRFSAEWSGIAAKLTSLASVSNSDAAVFNSEVNFEDARVKTEDRRYQLNLDAEGLKLKAAVEGARLAAQEVERVSELQKAGLTIMTSVYAQLTSAAYAMNNYSNSTSQSYSNGTTCGHSWSETHSYSEE